MMVNVSLVSRVALSFRTSDKPANAYGIPRTPLPSLTLEHFSCAADDPRIGEA